VIRVVSLEPFEEELIQKLCRILFQAYGLGCEHAGELPLPDEALKGGKIDAPTLLEKVERVASFADDKILYLTQQPLAERQLPSGRAPTPGFAQYSGERAVLSAYGLPQGDALLKRLAKQAIHDVGHLWELHHCLDPRCSMYTPWSPPFASGEPVLCPYCRDKSGEKIRLAKT
jgi:predicted Zn-dependent protease